MKLALVVLLAFACARQASANAYFGAVADSDNFTTIAVGSLFEHEGVVEWTVNVTDVAPGPVSIAIVDGHPPNAKPVVKLWSGEVDASGELSGAGSFTAADFEPTAQMPVDELFGRHLDHIYLEVTTAQGTLYGAWEQTDANGSPLPKDSDGHNHEHDDEHDHGAAAGAPSPAVQAQAGDEDHSGHDHSEDDHSGHNHRRMLSA